MQCRGRALVCCPVEEGEVEGGNVGVDDLASGDGEEGLGGHLQETMPRWLARQE